MAMITYDPTFSEYQSTVRGVSLREGVLSLINPSKNASYPDGCNIPCCTKTFEMTKNIVIDNQELLIVANLMTYGSTIGYIYKNVEGVWTYEAPIKTVEAITTFTKSRTCSAEIAVYANTVSTTNANLSGSINAVCMYELPNLTNVNYDVLSKYVMTPCYGRSGVSLATGVVLHGNATPVNPMVDAINSDFEFNRTDAKAFTINLLANQAEVSLLLPKWVNVAKGFKINSVIGGLTDEQTYGVPKIMLASSPNGTDWTFRATYTATTNLFIPNVLSDSEKSTHLLRVFISQDPEHGRFSAHTIDIVDPIIGNNDQIRHLVIIQGSIGVKNITINGRQRLQYMPTIENVPQMNLSTPVVYSPLVFELYNLLLRTQNYSLVMTRPEFFEFVSQIANVEDATILNIVGTATEGKASLLGAGMAISNLWKKAVKVAKKLGVQPATLLRTGVSKLGDLANSGINWMESAGYASGRHGFASEPKTTEEIIKKVPNLVCKAHELLYVQSVSEQRQEQLDVIRDAVVVTSSKYNRLLQENQQLVRRLDEVLNMNERLQQQLELNNARFDHLTHQFNNQTVKSIQKGSRITELEMERKQRQKEIDEMNYLISRLRTREKELEEEAEILRKQKERTRKLLTQQLNISNNDLERLKKKLFEVAIIMNSFVKYDNYIHLDHYMTEIKTLLSEEMYIDDYELQELIQTISKEMVGELLTKGFIDGDDIVKRHFSYGTASEQVPTYYDNLKPVPKLRSRGAASKPEQKPAIIKNDACIKADQANISSSQIWDAFGMGPQSYNGFASEGTKFNYDTMGKNKNLFNAGKTHDQNIENQNVEVPKVNDGDIITKEKIQKLMAEAKPISYGENYQIEQGELEYTDLSLDPETVITNNNFWFCNNITTDLGNEKFSDAQRTSLFVVVEHTQNDVLPWLYAVQISFKSSGAQYESFGSIQIDKQWAYKKDEVMSFFNFCLGDNRMVNLIARLKKFGKTLYVTFKKPTACPLDTFSGTSWTGAFYAALFARDALNVYEATACGRSWNYSFGGRTVTSYYSSLAPVGDMEVKVSIVQCLSTFITGLQEYNGPLSIVMVTHATNVEKIAEAWKDMVVFGNRTMGLDLFQPQVWLVPSDSNQLLGRTRYKVLVQTTIEREVVYDYDVMKDFIKQIVPDFKVKFKGKSRDVKVGQLLDEISKLPDTDTLKVAYKNLYGPYNFFNKKKRLSEVSHQPFKPEDYDQFNQLQAQISGIFKAANKDVIKEDQPIKKIKDEGTSFILPKGLDGSHVSNLDNKALNLLMYTRLDKSQPNSKSAKKKKRAAERKRIEELEKEQMKKAQQPPSEPSTSSSED